MIGEYQHLIEEVTDPASGVTYEDQVRVAESALAIKGYGQIKEAAIERWRLSVAGLRDQFGVRSGGSRW